MDRRTRLLAFAAVVAAGAAVVGAAAHALPAFGIPDLYGTAVTGAVGAAAIAAFWVLLAGSFDDEGYLAADRVARDAAAVVGSALFVAAALVALMDATGIADGSVRAGEAFVAAGPRLVATAAGVAVGVYAFYRRNRGRFDR